MGEKKKHIRIHDRKQFCTYCQDYKTNFASHLRLVHRKETEVARFLAYDVNDDKLMRVHGNHECNLIKIAQQKGDILLLCRPSKTSTLNFFFTPTGPVPIVWDGS